MSFSTESFELTEKSKCCILYLLDQEYLGFVFLVH